MSARRKIQSAAASKQSIVAYGYYWIGDNVAYAGFPHVLISTLASIAKNQEVRILK